MAFWGILARAYDLGTQRVQMTNGWRALISGFLVAVTSLLLPGDAFAAKDYFNNEPKSQFDPSLVEQWKEVDTRLPAYPRDADLVSVALGPTDTLKLYIDTNSVSLADDRVLRFTLIVESSSGARNVFFDGMRCETRQFKTYAVGSSDGKFVPVKNAQWQDIPRPSRNEFRFHLFQHFVCNDMSSALAPREFLNRLR